MRHILHDQVSAEMIYLNVRGLNSKQKQEQIKIIANENNNRNKIIALVETKLNKDFKIDGFKHCQTSHGTKGGCYIATNIERHKNIKTIFANLAWCSVAIKQVPIHIITCYIQSGTGREATRDIERLEDILSQILG